MSDLSQETATTERANLQAVCDRICGVSDYHEDECPLYQANNEVMWAKLLPLPVVPKMPPPCLSCGGSGFALNGGGS